MSDKLFIMQLLYFACISYKARKAKQIKKQSMHDWPVKQVFLHNKMTICPNIARYLHLIACYLQQ